MRSLLGAAVVAAGLSSGYGDNFLDFDGYKSGRIRLGAGWETQYESDERNRKKNAKNAKKTAKRRKVAMRRKSARRNRH